MGEVFVVAAIAAVVIFWAVEVNGAFSELEKTNGLLGPP